MSDVPPTDFESRFSELVARAGRRARDTGRATLASVVEVVEGLDPLAAMSAAEHAAASDSALTGVLASGRMIWSHSASGLALAAIGAATTISPVGVDRFAMADREWRLLLETALVDGTVPGLRAVGPVLMGGFSFEPGGPRTSRWNGFPATHLIVPSVLVATDGAHTALTTSVVVPPTRAASGGLDAVSRMRRAILSTPPGMEGVPSEPDEERLDLDFASERPASWWQALVRDAVTAIRDGEFRKVVLARAVATDAPRALDPMSTLEYLRAAQPDAFVFAYWRSGRVFLGASPERLARVDGRTVEVSSLAGSAPRGTTADMDASFAASLVSSTKDRAEHAMVHGFLVDTLTGLCDEVTSATGPSLLTLPHVHHLHTAVRARLRPDVSLLALAGALHPTPAVGGLPRDPALEFIRSREELDRGWYAAPIGWIGRDEGELAVALRSALLNETEATLFAGCGIVADSRPAQEYAESQTKLSAMQLAVAAGSAAETVASAAAAGPARAR